MVQISGPEEKRNIVPIQFDSHLLAHLAARQPKAREENNDVP